MKISLNQKVLVMLLGSAKIKELVSPKQVTKLLFNGADGENVVEKLYVNGRATKVEANESHGNAVLGKVTFGEIFTVKKAKAITFAKKQKVTYHVKEADKVKKIVCKKKGNAYRYTWNKTKTTVHTCKFDKKMEEICERSVDSLQRVWKEDEKGSI